MANRQRLPSSGRRGLTKIEVIVIAGLALFVLVTFGPPFWSGQGHVKLRKRSNCQSNLSSLGKAMYMYANDNADFCPVAPHAPATEDGKCAVAYAPGKIGTHRGNASDSKAGETTTKDTEMSVTRNLWTLVRLKLIEPQSFICPGTRDKPNRDDVPQSLWDFGKYSEVSYGMQVPYGKHGRATTYSDARSVFAADKGPFGAAMEDRARNPGPARLDRLVKAEDWAPWNSPNHDGDGESVLYADSHAEFQAKPIVGFRYDNIYTRWSDPTGGLGGDENIRVRGTPPTGNEAPFGDTDSLIYP